MYPRILKPWSKYIVWGTDLECVPSQQTHTRGTVEATGRARVLYGKIMWALQLALYAAQSCVQNLAVRVSISSGLVDSSPVHLRPV